MFAPFIHDSEMLIKWPFLPIEKSRDQKGKWHNASKGQKNSLPCTAVERGSRAASLRGRAATSCKITNACFLEGAINSTH